MNTSFKLSQIEAVKRSISKLNHEINSLADEQAFSDKVVSDWHTYPVAQLKTLEAHYDWYMQWRTDYLDCLNDNLQAEQRILQGLLK